MTRKDYLLIASAIKGIGPDTDTAYYIVEALAVALAKDNRRFDPRLFIRNCGFEPPSVLPNP